MTIFITHKYNQIYKGNSEKYKGKIRKQDISICGPYTKFCRISKMVGFTPEVLTLLLTPILTYIHMVYVRAPYMSYVSYMTYIKYITYIHLAFDIYIYGISEKYKGKFTNS